MQNSADTSSLSRQSYDVFSYDIFSGDNQSDQPNESTQDDDHQSAHVCEECNEQFRSEQSLFRSDPVDLLFQILLTCP